MKHILLTLLLAFAGLTAQAQQVVKIDLWPKGAPHKSSVKNDTASLYVYVANPKRATGRAVLICPGGGYAGVSMKSEGTDWAEYFNNLGITAAVLKYRLPHGKPEVPLEDGQEAMRVMRQFASEWRVNPNDIGVMGASAGGHLASYVATRGEGHAKPNFQILLYPVITMLSGITHQGSHDNLLGSNVKEKKEKQYSNDLHVSRVTPRAFIVLCDDDESVQPANGVNYYTELYRHDVPASLHVWPTGGHGWGSSLGFKFHMQLLMELQGWLESF